MFYVDPDRQEDIATVLAGMLFVQPLFDTSGSWITYYEPSHIG